MQKLLDRLGMWTIIALTVVVVVGYALWGAAVLRSQHVGGTLSDAKSAALTIL